MTKSTTLWNWIFIRLEDDTRKRLEEFCFLFFLLVGLFISKGVKRRRFVKLAVMVQAPEVK